MKFSLSPGHDAPQERALLKQLGPTERAAVHWMMDRAHEDRQTRALAAALGFTRSRASKPKAP